MALAKKPKTLKNTVNPLDWKIPIVNKNGTPTDEFMRKWLQQAVTNSTIVDLTTAAGVSAVLDLITAVAGSLLVRGAVVWQGLPPASDATKFLNGAATPAYAKVKDTDLAVTDVTGNNVSTAAHGFAPKAPNDATMFLNGLGAYSVPASSSSGAPASIQDDGTTVFVALSDTDGQLVLDGSGDPIFAPEVFSPSALPLATSSAFGAVKVDGTTIAALLGVVSAIPQSPIGFFAQLSANASVTPNTFVKAICDSLIFNSVGSQYSAITGRFTPTKAGTYLVWGSVASNTSVAPSQATISEINKNASTTIGTGIGVTLPYSTSASSPGFVFTLVALNGTTDFLELFGQAVAPSGTTQFIGTQATTYFGAVWLGP